MNAELDFTVAPARGNTKAAMKLVGAKSADLWQVDPRFLRVIDGFNVRQATPEYEEHIESITLSICENGYYSDRPIAGYVARINGENVIYVTDGHTRLAAVMRAIERGYDIATVPVVIKPAGSSMEDLTVALVKSNEGRPLAPLEIGMVCKRLVGMGLDEKTIAQRLGFSKNYIDGLLLLVGADKNVRDLVATGQVAATLAIQEMKRNPEDAPKRLQQAIQSAHDSGKQKATAKHLPQPDNAASTPPAEQPANANQAGGSEAPAGDNTSNDVPPKSKPDARPVLSGELDIGGLTQDMLRIDERLSVLQRLHDEINTRWEELVPIMEPNEHGVYTNPATIHSPLICNAAIVIKIARAPGGWFGSAWASFPTGGGGSSPSYTDKRHETATAALAEAAAQAERHILGMMRNHPDHNKTQAACKGLRSWLLHELTPHATPIVPKQQEIAA